MKLAPRTLYNLEAQNNVSGIKTTPKQVILAIDYGEKFFGLAFSPDSHTVLPIGIFKTQNFFEELGRVLEEKKVDFVVLGMPFSSDNFENKICEKIKKISKEITHRFSKKVVFVNERSSSKLTIKSAKNERIDDLAAMQILDFFLRRHAIAR